MDYAAWAWARGGDGLTPLNVAFRVARYALGVLVDLGRRMIHEAGHTFLGSGHCDPWGCCFDVAAEAWACRVQAWLGIPRQGYEPRYGGDYDHPDPVIDEPCETCSRDDGVTQYFPYRCDRVEEGVPYQRADHEAERCLDGQAWSACAYPPGEGGEGGPDKPWMHDPVVPTTPDRLSP